MSRKKSRKGRKVKRTVNTQAADKIKKFSLMDKLPEKKIKVLAYCDSPTCATGFGTVSRNILEGLYNTGRYEIDILGINYWGNPHNFPYRIWPVGTNPERDPYGRRKVCAGMIPKMEYDILFFLQDTFILDFLPELIPHLKQQGRKFKSICYFPVDGVPKKQWIKNVEQVDYLVAYTEFGRKAALEAHKECVHKDSMLVIPHGANTKDYFPHTEEDINEFRKQYFKSAADKFIFTNVNRNQQRKDIPRVIHAFKDFKRQVPESLLYLHMAQKDQGWNLPEVVKSYGLQINEDVAFPQHFSVNQGYPRQIVNMIYNCSDCIVSASLGEGWGLSWVEAMAAKVPVIMPNNTAMTENITSERGYLVQSGIDPGFYTVLPHDNEVVRPVVDTQDLTNRMMVVYGNYDEAKRRAENAYNWVCEELDWQKSVVPEWIKVFDKAYNDLVVEPVSPIQTVAEEKDNVIKAEEL